MRNRSTRVIVGLLLVTGFMTSQLKEAGLLSERLAGQLTGAECTDGIDNDGDGNIDALANQSPDMSATRTFGSLGRAAMNFIYYELALFPNNDSQTIDDDPLTTQRVCQLAGFKTVQSVTKRYFSSCGDNAILYWNGVGSWVSAPACSRDGFISTLVCAGRVAQCDNGKDDDFDGLTDTADGGCASATDTSEGPHDAQCAQTSNQYESLRQCQDGIDNNGNGLIDYPADPGCDSALDNDENGTITLNPAAPAACTLTNVETASMTGVTQMTKDAAGNLWFAKGDAIIRMSPAGVTTTFPVTVSGFNSVNSIAVANDGSIWYNGVGNGKIGKMAANGTMTTFDVPKDTVWDVVAGPDGNIWMTLSSEFQTSVAKITMSGTVTEYAVRNGATSTTARNKAIATGADGFLYYTSERLGVIGKISTSGVDTTIPFTSLFLPNINNANANTVPEDIAQGMDGNVWFTDPWGYAVGKVTPAGIVKLYAVPQQSGRPVSIRKGVDRMWFTTVSGAEGGIGNITSTGNAGVLSAHTQPYYGVDNSSIHFFASGVVSDVNNSVWFSFNLGSDNSRKLRALAQADQCVSAPVPATLVGHWNFDAATATSAPDVSGNNNVGTVAGATPLAGCMLFDGVDDRIDIPNMDREVFTFAAWAKKQNGGNGQPALIGSKGDGGWAVAYGMGDSLNGASGPQPLFLTKVGYSYTQFEGSVAPDEWHHITVTYDGSTAKLYVDGVLRSTKSYAEMFLGGDIYSLGFRDLVGGTAAQKAAANSRFKGWMDDVRIYDGVLTDAEIAAIVAVPPNCPNPSVDIKVNGQDGTVNVQPNTPVTVSWTAVGVTSCDTGNAVAPWGPNKPIALSGSQLFTAGFPQTLGIQCTSIGGTNRDVQDSIGINVAGACVALPKTASFSALTPGSTITSTQFQSSGFKFVGSPSATLTIQNYNALPPNGMGSSNFPSAFLYVNTAGQTITIQAVDPVTGQPIETEPGSFQVNARPLGNFNTATLPNAGIEIKAYDLAGNLVATATKEANLGFGNVVPSATQKISKITIVGMAARNTYETNSPGFAIASVQYNTYCAPVPLSCGLSEFYASDGTFEQQGWTSVADSDANTNLTGPVTENGVSYVRLADQSTATGMRTSDTRITDAMLSDRDWTLEMKSRTVLSDPNGYVLGMNMLLVTPSNVSTSLFIEPSKFGLQAVTPNAYTWGPTVSRNTADAFHTYVIKNKKNAAGASNDTIDVYFDGTKVLSDIPRSQLYVYSAGTGVQGISFGIGSSPGKGTMDVSYVKFKNDEASCPADPFKKPAIQCADGKDNDGDGKIDYATETEVLVKTWGPVSISPGGASVVAATGLQAGQFIKPTIATGGALCENIVRGNSNGYYVAGVFTDDAGTYIQALPPNAPASRSIPFVSDPAWPLDIFKVPNGATQLKVFMPTGITYTGTCTLSGKVFEMQRSANWPGDPECSSATGDSESGLSCTEGSLAEFPIPTAQSTPYRMAAGADGNMWFTEFTGNKVAKITPTGTVTEYGSGLKNAFDIALGHDGNMWFTQYATGADSKIGKVTPAGVVTTYPLGSGPTSPSMPGGIMKGPEGKMWFAVRDAIASSDSNGSLRFYRTQLGFGGPTAPIVGPDGNVWAMAFDAPNGSKMSVVKIDLGVTCNLFSGNICMNAVTVYPLPLDPNRSTSGTVQTPFMSIVNGPDGKLWYTRSDTNKVGTISTSGFIQEYPLPTTGSSLVNNLLVGPDGNLWASAFGIGKILKITTTGAITEYPVQTSSPSSGHFILGPDAKFWFIGHNGQKITSMTTDGTVANLASTADVGKLTSGVDNSIWFPQASWSQNKIGKISIVPCGSTSKTCTDSDGGNKPLVKGFANATGGAVSTGTDVCNVNGTLREYFCDANNTIQSAVATCDTGSSCVDGACMAAASSSAAGVLSPSRTGFGGVAFDGNDIIFMPLQNGDMSYHGNVLSYGPVCKPGACGDGTPTSDEQCDDGNTRDGDGCSAKCIWEPYAAVTARCGDSIISPPEKCDDGNQRGGDGCSAFCQVETGWQCTPRLP